MNYRWYLLLFAAVALAPFSLPTQAGSLKCVTERRGAFPLVVFNAGNALKLSSSLPMGTTVFHQSYTITVWCSISDPQQQGNELALFIRRNGSKILGNGLTLITTLNGDRGSDDGVVSTGVMITNHNAAAGLPPGTWQRASFGVTVEIVKTGQTPERPEQVTPINSRISLFDIGSDNGGKKANYQMLDAEKWLSFIAKSCKVQGPASFSVSLGAIRIRQDRGFGSAIGSTSEGKTFALNFLCDNDVSGNFNVMLRLDGQTPTGAAKQGLISLNSEVHSASGVAIQILHAASGVPVNIGSSWKIGNYPLARRTIEVLLLARYYQLTPSIKPGKATGILTWTISYL